MLACHVQGMASVGAYVRMQLKLCMPGCISCPGHEFASNYSTEVTTKREGKEGTLILITQPA
jgi:hypothetical protein